MSNVEKLRKRAADFEAKRQMDKAIATYLELFKLWDSDDSEIDVALYNRAGDMLIKEGNVGDAMSVWEKAVDYYADGGFHNNAIALCNKILRHSPGRTSIYYKLGKISAQKGFKGDAKKNFLEYADRMQKANKIDEAFRALKEFADLVPDEDDVRQMLAEQLAKLGRNDEAIEQLQVLYERYESTGDSAAAAAAVERMKAIDPSVEPKRSGPRGARETSGLVFIDVDAPAGRSSRKTIATPSQNIGERQRKSAMAGLPLIHEEEPAKKEPAKKEPEKVEPEKVELEKVELEKVELEKIELEKIEPEQQVAEIEVAPLAGLEPTAAEAPPELPAVVDPPIVEDVSFGASFGTETATEIGGAPMLDLEPTSLDAPVTGGERVSASLSSPEDATFGSLDLETFDTGISAEPQHIEALPDLDVSTPTDLTDGMALDLEMPTAGVAEPAAAEAMVLDGLPIIEDTMPTVDAPAPAVEETPAVEGAEAPRRGGRSTMSVLAQSVDLLGERLKEEPNNWQLHREYGEALLEDGNRDGGLEQLENAMIGFEHADDLESARSLADEIIRLNPHSVRHHQKRVEYAYRMADRPRLIEAYIELADALFRAGLAEKSKTVYQRVLELAPDDIRAQAALTAFVEEAPAPEPPPADARRTQTQARRYTAEMSIEEARATLPPVSKPKAKPKEEADGDFVDLEDWLKEDEGPKSTRMIVEEKEPTGDENADFNDMLRKFKQGVAENVEEEDHESHYDLGIAYKEMGLAEEAIAEFQKALRGTQHRVRTYEALGQCFMDRGQEPVAMTILQRALAEPGAGDDQLVGVLYLLGNAAETTQQPAEAVKYYQRVFAVDINFRDVQKRMRNIEQATR